MFFVPGEMIQSGSYFPNKIQFGLHFSNGLKPPHSYQPFASTGMILQVTLSWEFQFRGNGAPTKTSGHSDPTNRTKVQVVSGVRSSFSGVRSFFSVVKKRGC